jgi:hypothetical protein
LTPFKMEWFALLHNLIAHSTIHQVGMAQHGPAQAYPYSCLRLVTLEYCMEMS